MAIQLKVILQQIRMTCMIDCTYILVLIELKRPSMVAMLMNCLFFNFRSKLVPTRSDQRNLNNQEAQEIIYVCLQN